MRIKSIFHVICLSVFCTSAVNAAVSKTIANSTANELKKQIPMAEWGTINELSISGPIGASDLTFLSNVAKATNNLKVLDLSNATELLEIPKGTFNGIKSLTKIVLPSSTNTIAEKAFMDCTNLSEISLNEGLTTISDRAFCNDSLLTTITLPSSLGDLSISALDGCNNIESIQVAAGNQYFESVNGVLYRPSDGTLVKYPVSRAGTEFSIPEGTKNIGEHAFIDTKLLTSIEIPNSLKTIGKAAFSNCKGIRYIIIGTSTNTIADFAFKGCTNLRSVVLPRDLKTIGDGIFSMCCNIESIRCEADVPPTYSSLINSPFTSEDASICSIDLLKCVLSVPNKSLQKYTEAKGWNSFENIEGFQVGK